MNIFVCLYVSIFFCVLVGQISLSSLVGTFRAVLSLVFVCFATVAEIGPCNLVSGVGVMNSKNGTML